jgi:hypothetical protein
MQTGGSIPQVSTDFSRQINWRHMPKPKKEKRVPRIITARDAVFVYISACCSSEAEKPACVVAKGQRIGEYLGAKPEGEATLGTWRCRQCRKPCKVSRNTKSTAKALEVIVTGATTDVQAN